MNAHKVGELSKKTGISVRTLHHYDEVGLLAPSGRTDTGHRLYTNEDVVKLQQILSMKELGFSLVEIGNSIGEKKFSISQVVKMHASKVEAELEAKKQLKLQLEILSEHLEDPGRFRVEDLFEIIGMINKLPNYFNADQLEKVRNQRKKVGEDRIREVEQEWPKLMAEVETEMKAGTDPASPEVKKLAKRWRSLWEEFTGGDPEVEAATANYLRSEPKVREAKGIDLKLMEYISKAM